ncbi:MAG: Unknown protein [uncultured Campylobacterales bacterium]|uniref:Uncharacterized protein n=1 Tax=uncultured Campylobacterales bacterium TaxID=352960 RepID=A0A6S6T0A7_9BACT|nr:MAG: Unknown protein [uncultured Campylobacterales bacterium]
MGLLSKFFYECFVSINIKDDSYEIYYEVYNKFKVIKTELIHTKLSSKELSHEIKKLQKQYKKVYIGTITSHNSQNIIDYNIDFIGAKKSEYKTVFLDHKWGVGISKEILDSTNKIMKTNDFDFIISIYLLAFFEVNKMNTSNSSTLVIYENSDFYLVAIMKNQKFICGNIYNSKDIKRYEKSDIIYNSCVSLIEDFYKTTFDNFVEEAVIISHQEIAEDVISSLKDKLLLSVQKEENSEISKSIISIMKKEASVK